MKRDREQSLRRRPESWRRACLALLLAGVWAGGAVTAAPADFEIELADAARQKLSPAETRGLGRADKHFSDGKLAEAVAEYDVFLTEFPKSAAASYALVRKGRATQKAGDPAKAIKLFNEALDLYSDSVDCSVPALYFSGQCQVANRDLPAAVKAWKEIAEDKDYRRHPGAAHALGSLAGLLLEQGRIADATKYYLQEAVDFPKTREAVIDQVLGMHIRGTPNVEAVREVVKTLQGLEAKPRPELAADEKYFWDTVRKAVHKQGNFYGNEQAQKLAYYRYWVGVLEGKIPDEEEAQIEWAQFQRITGLSEEEWTARLDRLFAALQKPGDSDRIVRWILLFGDNPRKAEEYFAKLDFSKLKNETILRYLEAFAKPLPELAKRTCANLHFDELDEHAKARLIEKYQRTLDLAPIVIARMKNPDDGRMTLLRFWETDEGMNRYIQTETRVKEGLPLAERLLAMPAYAKEANLLKAGILRRAGRYEEAIAAYQASDDPPRHLLGIADCYLALKQTDKAVEQWREVARKFEARAPEMAFKIAQAYRDAGQTDQYETELREIVRTYLKHPDLVERARAELEALKKPK